MNFITAGAAVVVALYRPNPFIRSHSLEPYSHKAFYVTVVLPTRMVFLGCIMCGIIATIFIFRRWSASTERINSAMKPWSPGATVIFDLQCSSDLSLPSRIFDLQRCTNSLSGTTQSKLKNARKRSQKPATSSLCPRPSRRRSR